MFKILKLGIRKKGIVTTKYPTEKIEPFANTKGMPKVDMAKCSRKAVCAKVCPTNAIVVSQEHVVIDLGLCIFCGNCAASCPEKAITISHDVELSTKSKDHLKVEF